MVTAPLGAVILGREMTLPEAHGRFSNAIGAFVNERDKIYMRIYIFKIKRKVPVLFKPVRGHKDIWQANVFLHIAYLG